MIDKLDKKIIAAMQVDIPLVKEPYKLIADQLGITETELLKRLHSYKRSGKLRKMGVVLRHRQVGYAANALCIWRVDDKKVHEIGTQLAAHAAVTHCYSRQTSSSWPYNLYAMVHAASCEECKRLAGELAAAAGLMQPVMLFSVREWKKTSMHYFSDSL
ncbi:MAG: AsnC family transcriptional regulator [Pelosinus sp.]|nr:AsnC family transcriptional regulator [Pelosinus sp.]